MYTLLQVCKKIAKRFNPDHKDSPIAYLFKYAETVNLACPENGQKYFGNTCSAGNISLAERTMINK